MSKTTKRVVDETNLLAWVSTCLFETPKPHDSNRKQVQMQDPYISMNLLQDIDRKKATVKPGTKSDCDLMATGRRLSLIAT